MIIPYYGMVLFSTTALELSLNPCSHRCAYCFSRLNAYQRKASFQSIMNLIKDFRNRNTYTAKLLQEGYAVCVSNRSDPFAESNYREMVPIIEAMTSQNIQIDFQTKGGKGIDDVLSFIPKSHWYITICSEDDALMKEIEPGAPSVSDRFKLIEKLVSKGHDVEVGINPAVERWINDADSFVRRIKDSGAQSAIFYPLHISGYQKGRQTQTEKELLSFVKIKKDSQTILQEHLFMRKLNLLCTKYNINTEGWLYGEKTNVHYAYQKRYKCLPIFADFMNWVIDNKADGDIVTFTEFKNTLKDIPRFEIPLRDYCMGQDRHKDKIVKLPTQGSFEQLLKYAWCATDTMINPVHRVPSLAYVVDYKRRDDGKYQAIQNPTDGRGVMMYKKTMPGDGFNLMYPNGEGVLKDEYN